MALELWNPLFVALVSTIAIAMQVASNLVCDFITVEAKDGEILAITETSHQDAQESTSIGLNCDGDFYIMGEDKMWKIANIFSLVALVIGVITLLLSWSVVAFSPTVFLWKSIAVAASTSAMLQIPAFVIFESFPCSDFQEQQECKLASGSYMVIASVAAWIASTAITQFLDPPLWREQLHLWKLPHRATGETESDPGGHHFDGRDDDIENGSQDPVFAPAFEQSDNLTANNDRSAVLGRVKSLFGRSTSKASSDGSVDRVVQSYSFSVPAEVKDTTNRLNREVIVDVDEATVDDEEMESEDDEVDDGVTGPMPQPAPPVISADESILDTITGEESLLDGHHPTDEVSKTTDNPKADAEVALNGAPIYESLIDQDEQEENEHSSKFIYKASLSRIAYESMLKEETATKEAEAKAALVGAPVYESLMKEDENEGGHVVEPVEEKLEANPNPTTNATTMTKGPDVTEEVPPRDQPTRGLFAMAKRRNRNYHHMIENDSVSPMRDAPPMKEIAIDNEATIQSGENPMERGLLSDWNQLFDLDREKNKPLVSDGESSLNDDENFDVDERPPDTSDDEESEAEKYDASSEYEETGESSAAEGFFTSENDEADDEEEEEEPERSSQRKVLRPPRKPKRHNHGGSVSSSHSLLSYTIEEETEEDLRNDSDNYKSPVRNGIRRTTSVPNLTSYGTPTKIKGVAEDVSNTHGVNSYHAVELHREDPSDNKSIMSMSSGLESTLTGPQPFQQARGREQPRIVDNTDMTEPSPLRKKRSKSLEVRPKKPSDSNIWKSEREIRKGIHQAPSFASSGDSSGDDMSASGGEKARLARIQRLQSHNLPKSRAPMHTYGNFIGQQYFSRRAHVVSPEPSSEDVSIASQSDIDAAESFLLDTVDVSLAKLARNTDDEYGSEENSI
mmetsp:Transcript_4077/g.11103  ORF Transcript_4077/g.11103 Transcript_4077/m.11103 type:complete len:908 (+) Transcript_4077:67-2790(+)